MKTRQRVLHTAAILAVIVSLAPDGARAAGTVDPIIRISGGSPFVGCNDFLNMQPGTVFVGSEVEPWVAVNPVDPLNIVATWQQDRWSNGGARGLVVGASFNGGLTWTIVPVPGLTLCTGGPFLRASDPWLSFGPDGTLHHIALVFQPPGGPRSGMWVNTSTDGGLTWSAPVSLVLNLPPLFHDKEAITADPTDPTMVYAVWDRLDSSRNLGPAVFTRSTDGGVTWEPVRVIYQPGFNRQTIANQLVVLPDGTLIDFFTEIRGSVFSIAYKWSEDKGVSWRPPGASEQAVGIFPINAVDPDTSLAVRDGAFLFDVAVDPRSGALYLVWQDARFSGFQISSIGFSMSTDGGRTWSPPAAVNRTPADLPLGRRQAFIPSVHAADNGTVGITYYDFRFNDGSAGAATDHWFTWCHPRAADCTNPERWREELRLTDGSFDILQAPRANGLFVGDYVGLTSAGGDFIAVFTQPHDGDRSSAFVRRVMLDDKVEPRGAGFWTHQVQAARTGRGRAEVAPGALLEFLEDVQALYDLFDDVEGLEGLESILVPRGPATMRGRAARQVMALLLNLTSYRIPPFTVVRDGETLDEVAAALVAVLEDPAAGHADLESVKDTAEALNEGYIPLP